MKTVFINLVIATKTILQNILELKKYISLVICQNIMQYWYEVYLEKGILVAGLLFIKTDKNSLELYCVTSFGLKTEMDEIRKDKNYG